MRTLVGAVDPPPRRPVDGPTFTTGSSAAGVVSAFLAVEGVTLTDWQATVLSAVYDGYSGPRGPFRTTAIAGDLLPTSTPAIEGEVGL